MAYLLDTQADPEMLIAVCPHRARIGHRPDLDAATHWCADVERPGSFALINGKVNYEGADYSVPTFVMNESSCFVTVEPPLFFYFSDPNVAFEFKLRWG